MRLRQSQGWQKLAWRHYDAIGEVKYAFNYFANALSRVRFYAAYSPDDRDGPPVPIGSVGGIPRDVVTASRFEVAKMDTAHGGQPGLVRSVGLNLSVTGECYLVEYPSGMFNIYSTNEIRVQGARSNTSSGVQIIPRRMAIMSEWIDLPKDAFIARIWRPHPAWSDEADSSMLGVHEPCEELLMLSRLIQSIAMSQIPNGIVYVADELSFKKASDVAAELPPDDPDAPQKDEEEDAFEEEFAMHMTEPIEDPLSPEAVLPLLVRGPADMADNAIKYITLDRPFDEKLINLRENALDRVLNGLDIPKDLVTGLSNVRYSNAQQITESLYKAHVEPMAVLMCEAFTVVRLRPALIARGIDPAKIARTTVWYDASEVVTNANRGQDADNGHDRMLIKDAAWRRDHGYSEADKPDDEELTRRLAEKSSLAPETAIQLLAALTPLIGELAKSGQIVLQPSSMNPQRPPHIPAVQQAALPGPPGGQAPPLPIPAAPASPAAPAAPAVPATATPSNGVPVGRSGASRLPDQGAPEGTPAPRNVVASANGHRPRSVGDGDMRRLVDIERKLRTSLQIMFTDMTERALEKAGSRLASKVRGNPELTARIKDVPKTMVAAALGHEAITAAGYTDQQLITDSVNESEAKYRQQLKQAQLQAARVVGQQLITDHDIDGSWSVLKPLLVSFILRAMFRKEQGEYVPKLPMDSIRAALARAGGAQPKGPAVEGRPQPGAALSEQAVAALADKHDAEPGGYRWIYGISDNHFQPHLDLDGREFADWTDPVLKNHGSFPRSKFLYPGDHGGCECDWIANLFPRQPHEGRIAEHIEVA